MPTIFITEKPSVAREYISVLGLPSTAKQNGFYEGFSPYLNKNVIVTWAVGHLISLKTPEGQDERWNVSWENIQLPMIPQKYKYQPIEKSRDQFVIVKSLYNRPDIDEIYYAGDSAREGVYIQALIRNAAFGANKPKFPEYVVWLDSFTDAEIKRGIAQAKPLNAYGNLINAGYARAITDWLIGMNFTVGFTVAANFGRTTLHIGRVQSPTLAMVVKRQKEIEGFTKTYYYGIKADIPNRDIFWRAMKGTKFFESDELYNENGFLKAETCNALIDTMNRDKRLYVGKIKIQKKKNKRMNQFI